MLHTAVGFSLVLDNVVCGSAMLGALAESRQCAQGQQLLIEGDLFWLVLVSDMQVNLSGTH